MRKGKSMEEKWTGLEDEAGRQELMSWCEAELSQEMKGSLNLGRSVARRAPKKWRAGIDSMFSTMSSYGGVGGFKGMRLLGLGLSGIGMMTLLWAAGFERWGHDPGNEKDFNAAGHAAVIGLMALTGVWAFRLGEALQAGARVIKSRWGELGAIAALRAGGRRMALFMMEGSGLGAGLTPGRVLIEAAEMISRWAIDQSGAIGSMARAQRERSLAWKSLRKKRLREAESLEPKAIAIQRGWARLGICALIMWMEPQSKKSLTEAERDFGLRARELVVELIGGHWERIETVMEEWSGSLGEGAWSPDPRAPQAWDLGEAIARLLRQQGQAEKASKVEDLASQWRAQEESRQLSEQSQTGKPSAANRARVRL